MKTRKKPLHIIKVANMMLKEHQAEQGKQKVF